ncbi:MAG TPA: glutamate-5-semialdehyde dehydrogenase, partial [Nitrospira sp.]|nr:glutamate-5-semialdehyde dehydrogenase [Nitrospira sp.]
MPDVPVKLYLDKLLKDSRSVARKLALLSGPAKDKVLRAMANRLEVDGDAILAANGKDVDAVGKSFEGDVKKDRMKAAVARVRMAADSIKEMAERVRVIADLPDPVGAVTARWERPDGFQVERVRVP